MTLVHHPPIAGCTQVLEDTLEDMREDLKRLVQSRLDQRLSGRVDPSDIVQDCCLTAFRRYGEYTANPEVSLKEWIRFLTVQAVQIAHRAHLQSQKRAVGKEFVPFADESLGGIVDFVAGSITGPQSAVIRSELQDAVRELIESMSDIDREILRLRHEQRLSNKQCAEEMGISERAASKRYIRALKRLSMVAEDHIQ